MSAKMFVPYSNVHAEKYFPNRIWIVITFPVELAPNGIPLGSKLITKV